MTRTTVVALEDMETNENSEEVGRVMNHPVVDKKMRGDC